MNKVVINTCFGGFGISPKGVVAYYKRKGQDCFVYKEDHKTNYLTRVDNFDKANCFWARYASKDLGPAINVEDLEGNELESIDYDVPRHDKDLVAVVEELGEESFGDCAKLSVVEIESNMYRIDEYDGNESIITPDTGFDWIVIKE